MKRKNIWWKKKKNYVFNFSNCEIPFSTYANYISNLETLESPFGDLYVKMKNRTNLPSHWIWIVIVSCIIILYTEYRTPYLINLTLFSLIIWKGKSNEKNPYFDGRFLSISCHFLIVRAFFFSQFTKSVLGCILFCSNHFVHCKRFRVFFIVVTIMWYYVLRIARGWCEIENKMWLHNAQVYTVILYEQLNLMNTHISTISAFCMYFIEPLVHLSSNNLQQLSTNFGGFEELFGFPFS